MTEEAVSMPLEFAAGEALQIEVTKDLPTEPEPPMLDSVASKSPVLDFTALEPPVLTISGSGSKPLV